MKQLIYRSHPFGFDKAMLAGILSQARRNNPANRITGALICRGDMYLQLIEGPVAAINALYARIVEDDRHANVELLLAERVERRIFPDWAMLDDQNPTLTWSKEEIAQGALSRASHADLRAVFERIAERALKGEN
ncbi:MAG: BLUF domain-containing protein [Pseudomonadota bacterium]